MLLVTWHFKHCLSKNALCSSKVQAAFSCPAASLASLEIWVPWWSFGTRPCCIRLQGLKIEACTRVYPQVSCLQRQAYKRSDSRQLAACACMSLWYCICQLQQVRHCLRPQRWACMKLIAAT